MDSGIKATDNRTGQEFFFYTEIQSDVENAMTLMGYGCRGYNLSNFKDRVPPIDIEDTPASLNALPDPLLTGVRLPGLDMFKKWLHDNGLYQRNAEHIHKFLTTPVEYVP
jgi:hypothetical protein